MAEIEKEFINKYPKGAKTMAEIRGEFISKYPHINQLPSPEEISNGFAQSGL